MFKRNLLKHFILIIIFSLISGTTIASSEIVFQKEQSAGIYIGAL
jgi:hypothetical protein